MNIQVPPSVSYFAFPWAETKKMFIPHGVKQKKKARFSLLIAI